ncbi:MAG: hypothetical protein JWQ38_1852 [Flavipsychrobacter sp.]|nr:hypothetical protein [Flavipsychrobacter sp.]
METNMQNQQAEENTSPLLPEDNVLNSGTGEEGNNSPNKGRKKYHSSALYAASLWHNTVKHVKPTHPQIER